MIYVGGEAALLEPSFTKQPLRALRPFALQLSPEPIGASADTIEVRAGEVLAVACGGNVHDADVHAEPTENLLLLDVRDIDRDEEVELRTAQHEVRLSTLMDEKRALMFTADERDGLATGERPEACGVSLPGQDSLDRTQSIRGGERLAASSCPICRRPPPWRWRARPSARTGRERLRGL